VEGVHCELYLKFGFTQLMPLSC